jgi:hypothetical protein
MFKGKLSHIFFFLFILLMLGVGYFYFFQISPTFVNKPQMEKPLDLENNDSTNFRQISYMLNELGAYKLHEDLLTGEMPVIEVDVEDTGQVFFAQIEKGEIKETRTKKPDIRISAKKETFSGIFMGTIDRSVVSAVSDGSMIIDILSDERSLALKGYKSIYDSLSQNAMTGNFVGKLNPIGFVRGIEIFLFLLFALTVGMIIEKEI